MNRAADRTDRQADRLAERQKGGALFYNYLPVVPQQKRERERERSKLGTNKELAGKSANMLLLLASR
jgi:hypothetical protein